MVKLTVCEYFSNSRHISKQKKQLFYIEIVVGRRDPDEGASYVYKRNSEI